MTRVGLAGAGPWATVAMGPMLAAHPDLELSGVWARRSEAASALAGQLGARGVAEFDQLLDGCDAVLFCVPPDVQCALGARAAAAGKHLLLDKPVGLTVTQVEELLAVVTQHGVTTQVLFTNRYASYVRDFVAEVSGRELHGLQMTWVNGAVTEGQLFATPWRLAEGCLFDLGPHAFDLAQACAGPVAAAEATVNAQGLAAVVLTHESGALSSLTLGFATARENPVWRLQAFDATTH
ncbi:MAG: oxidoreductase [Frankiales bacterium]|nr:oxidoreductase [Frankiales bacterium]